MAETLVETITVDSGEADFTVRIHDATNREYLNYARFMQALHNEKMLRVHVLNTEEDLFVGNVNNFNYKTGFQTAEEEIDFLERICAIEDYFQVTMTIDGDISKKEYDTVVWISKLISQEEVETKWSEVNCTGILDHHFRERLIDLDAEIHMLSYVGHTTVNLFGAQFEFDHMRTYKCAIMQDFDRVKKKAEVLDDGDEIRIKFKPGEDDTEIDTLKIPNQVLTEGVS